MSAKLQVVDNPYPVSKEGAEPSASYLKVKEPLHGFIPRKVTGRQVLEALLKDSDVNPFTKQPHSAQYKKIYESRKKLPVFRQLDEFMEIFSENQFIVIVGETGSGKTTQIPQFVAFSDLPHTRRKLVACTQPRTVAAISAAQRVADEMDVSLGRHVGYSLPFGDMTEPGTTFLKYMTDDMLLREAMNDPKLEQYSTIIVDEVHERTIATDILMGLLTNIAKKHKDLKIIIMSDNIDTSITFQAFLSKAKDSAAVLFKVPGCTHPVEVLYTQKPEPDYMEAAIRTVLMIHLIEDPGDILLFLAEEEEIEDICREIKLRADDLVRQDPNSVRVGPLVCIPFYSSLPPERYLIQLLPPVHPNSPRGRNVIVSTKIAETSSIIDGIVYVVDPGFSVQSVYNPRIRVKILLTNPISKASSQQRAAQAGRTRPGKCFRLYTKKDFMQELEEKTHPEILRGELSSTVLTMVKLGIKVVLTHLWD